MAGLTLVTSADTANMAKVSELTIPPTRGLRARRTTTQAATAASQDRSANVQFSRPAKTTASLSTDLRNSDSTKKAQGELTADIAHTDEDGLHFAGYRGPEFFSDLDRGLQGSEMSICVCESTASAKNDMEVENLIKCSVRDCKVEWFHLVCVNLPDHPPRGLGWMCRQCIRQQGIAANVKGLFDVKSTESTLRAKMWLTEMAKELRERDKAEARERKAKELREREKAEARERNAKELREREKAEARERGAKQGTRGLPVIIDG